MLEKLQIFRMAQGMARHASTRQALIAENVANADTPGYRARDIASFRDSYSAEPALALRATRPGHLPPGESRAPAWRPFEAERPGALSPNGNSVSLETELMMAAEAQDEQQRALAIYRSALNVLRTSLGRK